MQRTQRTAQPHPLPDELARWTTKRYSIITVLFIVAGVFWILVSDAVTGFFVQSAERMARIEILKGIGFVVATGGALFAILKRLDTTHARNIQTAGHILENLPDGIIFYGSDNRILSMNSSARTVLGIEDTGLLKMDKTRLFREGLRFFDDAGNPLSCEDLPSSRAMENGETVSDRRLHILRPDGSSVWIAVNAVPIPQSTRNPNGAAAMAVAVSLTDITENKIMQDRIAESERIFRTLLESAPIGIGMVGDGRVLRWCNPYMSWLTGISEQELQGRTTEILYYNRDEFERAGRELYRVLEQRLGEGKGCRSADEGHGDRTWADATHPVTAWTEAVFSGPSRRPVDVLISLTPLQPDTGRTEYLFTVTDITMSKQAEAALRDSEERFKGLADLLPQSVWETDRDGNFTYVNKAGYEIFGYRPEDFESGISVCDVVVEECKGRVAENFRLLLDGKEQAYRANSHEYSCVTKDGTRFPALIYSSPICRNGERVGVRGITLDITERKQAEETLRKSHDQLEERVRKRTWRLTKVNRMLKRVITERRQAENREQRRNSILTALAAGEPLEAILQSIAESIEIEDPGSIAALMLVDAENSRLLLGAAPTLPDCFARAIRSLPIGPDALPCGEAASTGRRVVAEDLPTHPAWAPFREEARKAGLRSCWSQPVLSARESVIATCDIYGRVPRSPRRKDEERLRTAASLASLAIERKRAEEDLKRSHEELEDRVRQRTAELTRLNRAMKAEIAEREQAEQKLNYLSFHDSLTGLYNRNYFDIEMNRLHRDDLAAIGIIVCDVNGLKFINDTLGHRSGDELLVQTAAVLRSSVRHRDVVARIGGDEFAILMPDAGEDSVEALVEQVRSSVEEHNRRATMHISLSIGHSMSDRLQPDMQALFKEADNRMYREKMQREKSSRSHIVRALMKAMEARDFVTQGHSNRLQQLVLPLARSCGLPEDSVNDLLLLARFHDLGKVGISDAILNKPGKLSESEFREMRKHSEIGHRIAHSVPELAPIAELILKHHEWWNGLGYPLGLAGEDIPLPCRILAIADAFDAMTSDRPYREAMSREAAVEELRASAGSQFDPELVERFIHILGSAQD
jgi:diguanylate cyclase (GGDEF)-like protein/PAS domain S-box-containing protein